LVDRNEVAAVADAVGRYSFVRDGKHYYRLDVGIAMAHFFLAAREMGWSGSWQVTGFGPAQVAKAHAIPDDYEVLGIYRR
jgi:nitroreductase